MSVNYRSLRDFLKKQKFGHRLKITGKRDSHISGRFDVMVLPSAKLLHRKGLNGGYATSEKERRKIIKQIESILATKGTED